MRGWLLVTANLCLALVVSGCAGGRKEGARHAAGREESAPAALPTTTYAMDYVLKYWGQGEWDEAIGALVELTEAGATDVCYRPLNFTEQEFLALPYREREGLREEMLEQLRVLREIASKLQDKAQEAADSGDLEGAAKFLKTMKRLGESNRGPEVTLLVDLVGKAIERRADEKLATLRR